MTKVEMLWMFPPLQQESDRFASNRIYQARARKRWIQKTGWCGLTVPASLVGKERGSIGTRIIFSFFRFQPERRKAFRLTSFPIT